MKIDPPVCEKGCWAALGLAGGAFAGFAGFGVFGEFGCFAWAEVTRGAGLHRRGGWFVAYDGFWQHFGACAGMLSFRGGEEVEDLFHKRVTLVAAGDGLEGEAEGHGAVGAGVEGHAGYVVVFGVAQYGGAVRRVDGAE